MANNISWMGNRVLDPGMPRQTAPSFTAEIPVQNTMPAVPEMQEGPPPATDKGYIPNYLRSNIGKNVRAEFIIGTNQYTDKTGMLSEVGVNYFVLRDVNSRTDTMCDLYSVKFVTVLQP